MTFFYFLELYLLPSGVRQKRTVFGNVFFCYFKNNAFEGHNYICFAGFGIKKFCKNSPMTIEPAGIGSIESPEIENAWYFFNKNDSRQFPFTFSCTLQLPCCIGGRIQIHGQNMPLTLLFYSVVSKRASRIIENYK